MIYESLIVPDEHAPTLQQVKRALLTYDKVILVAPEDRDLMPQQALLPAATGFPPIIAMAMGPVRPLGKVNTYDEDFDRLLRECAEPIRQRLVEVRSTYAKQSEQVFTVGGIDLGGYPLNYRNVYGLYRTMAGNQEFLLQALGKDHSTILKSIETNSGLALKGAADNSVNSGPATPAIEIADVDLKPADVDALSFIARSRLAAFIKHAGYCEAKTIVPLFGSTYAGIAALLLKNISHVLNQASEDRFWCNRNRALSLCYDEYLSDDALAKLSMGEVLSLRTSAWGRQATARDHMFSTLFRVSQDAESTDDFETSVKALVRGFRAEAENAIKERERLMFDIKCDVGVATLLGGIGLIGLAQVASPLGSIGAALGVGGAWALDKAKSYLPQMWRLKEQEQKCERSGAFGIHRYFVKLHRSS